MASSAFPQATFIDFMGATGEVPQDFLSGSIASMSSSSKTGGSRMQDVDLHTDFDTLEEPIRDTVRRDVRTVGAKFQHVLFPGSSDRKRLLKEWDLWGPLFICVFLSLLLHSQGGDAAPQFTQVFSLTFFGSIVVTLNIKLLGGEISFFQSLCVIGYCLLPPTISALLCSVLLSGRLFFLRLGLTALGFSWATYAAMGFLAEMQPPKKRLLVIYPIFLFYFIVSWLIVSHT